MHIDNLEVYSNFISPFKKLQRIIFTLIQIAILISINIPNLCAQNNHGTFQNATWQIDSIDQGVTHFHHHFEQDSLFDGLQNINYLKIDLKVASQALTIARADSGMVYTSTFAEKAGALAAVNGSFFNTKTGASVNFMKIKGSITDSTYYDEKQKELKANQEGILAFDSTGIEIIPRIFADKYWWEKGLNYENALESGPLLIKAKIPKTPAETPFSKNRHPRTAVCLTDGSLIMLTADGRNSNAYGLTLGELTEIFTWLNCTDALNLDGGGSTTMYLKSHGVVNMPSDNKLWDHEGERAVNNALLLLPTVAN